MNKPLLKLLAAGLAMSPIAGLSQDSNSGDLNPNRLGIGEASAGIDDSARLTRKGQVLPGEFGSTLEGLPEAPSEIPAEQTVKLPDSVANLKPAQKYEIQTLLQEAATFIQGIRLQEGLDRLIQIEAISPDLYQTYNLRGAIFTKLRDFGKARQAFNKALELQPGLMEALFNLAELDFVEKKFASSVSSFTSLKANNPNLRPETIKLIDYKLFIATLLQSQAKGDAHEKKALAMLDGFDFLDDYPVYYYGQAALAFNNDDKEEAESWMTTAQRIYNKTTQTIYIDALIEMGWVDSL
jgi:tetratricopeptide (TPR) repeat protein|tara:strand:+ start:112 stop:999 length:888 start_codon:yes stop_codon:yes gene_type:complete